MSAVQETVTTAPGLPEFTIQGACARIRLNRERYLNRIEPDDVPALLEMLERAQDDPAIRVLVLTGTGRVFSSGYHLGDLAERRAALDTQPAGEPEPPQATSPFDVLLERLENLRVPTICRLNGSVYGGATDLALCCDFRIGEEGIEMFMPASRLGLHYYRSGMVRYVSRLGVNAAKKLFLTSQTIKAPEMLRVGYLTEMVPAGGLDAEVERLAGVLAGQAPLAVAGMKQAINELARGELDADALDARHAASLRSEDIREGVTAWHERRKPVFQGR
ncbi:enoyl-CoA hydratase/isomerase family protein [Verticiella sediminum]|uniref:Enoyl-CoA hydratase/isomerase family protein n=2 Tax=Verticiella sediminum TaxID=1247510 RepID=A0A556AQE8_9BURK|nr:enoyl-CoA hydratase/isomerase family protein [Verticiella sediminum]